MTEIFLGVGIAALFSYLLYLGREKAGGWGIAMAFLRTIGLAGVILVLLNPGFVRRAAGGPPTVLLDASLSMTNAAMPWSDIVDSARAMAGTGGTVLRWGRDVELFDDREPDQSASLLREPLLVGTASGGPLIVVTDGLVGDVSTIPASVVERAGVITVPVRRLPDAALLDVTIPRYVGSEDSVDVVVTLATYSGLDTDTVRLEITGTQGSVATRAFVIESGDAIAKKRLRFPASRLSGGLNVVDFAVLAPGDMIPENDRRVRLVTVTEQPGIVVVADPIDWEGRFLFRGVNRVARTSVRGFARIQDDLWIEMSTGERTDAATVDRALRGASVLITRTAGPPTANLPSWHWPAGVDSNLELFGGDWYATASEVPSPLAGRLAGVQWDSLPPLTGVVPLIPAGDEWSALASRQGRRGAARPVLLGRETGRVRSITTVASGLWRWGFRGGASLEAYRAILSAGIDWLLGADVLRDRAPLTASEVVRRGEPVVFTWQSDSVPDFVGVSITGGNETRVDTLSLDADNRATAFLEPGIYTWTSGIAPNSSGTIVVESYSDEFVQTGVTIGATTGAIGEGMVEYHLRDNWWIYLLVVSAFAGEWAIRQRRGLP